MLTELTETNEFSIQTQTENVKTRSIGTQYYDPFANYSCKSVQTYIEVADASTQILVLPPDDNKCLQRNGNISY